MATYSIVIVGRATNIRKLTLRHGGKSMGYIVFGIVLLLGISVLVAFLLLIRALIKFINSKSIREEKNTYKKSLGENIKAHREECKMTQEFVAEAIGVSRQAVSKWENGSSDPSTSNLIALAKLFNVAPEDLIK